MRGYYKERLREIYDRNQEHDLVTFPQVTRVYYGSPA